MSVEEEKVKNKILSVLEKYPERNFMLKKGKIPLPAIGNIVTSYPVFYVEGDGRIVASIFPHGIAVYDLNFHGIMEEVREELGFTDSYT